jgi:hypothetical protein
VLASLKDEAVRDILSKTESELRREATEDGEDFDLQASRVRVAIVDAAAKAKRQSLIDARKQLDSVEDLRVPFQCPPIQKIREILTGLTQSDPAFAVNFRSGKTQTENDLISLYRQLVELGKVRPLSHD